MNTSRQNTAGSGKVRQSAASDETDAPSQGLWTIIWSRRWTVLLVTAACLTAAAAYLATAVPVYTSTSRLYVEQVGPKIIADSEGVMTQSKNYLSTQCELLKSAPILSAALSRPGIRRMSIFADVDNPIAHLKTNLDVQVGKKDDLISISFDSPRAEEAARMVNSVVDAYVTYHTQQKRSTAATVLHILRDEKVKRDAELAAKLEAMLAFKQANGDLSLENNKGNIAVQILAGLSDSLTKAQLETIETKTDLRTLKAMMDDPVKARQLIESEYLRSGALAQYGREASLRADMSRMQLEMIALEAEYTGNHPAVQAMRARISYLESQLGAWDKRVAEGYLAIAREREAAARRKEAEIRSAFERQKRVAQNLGVKAARYAALRSDLRRAERLCDILDTRIKELDVTEDAGALNINVLEKARAEKEPSSPGIARTALTALAVGLVLGIFAALIRDHTDQRFHSVADISAVLDTPILGSVPLVPGRKSAFVCGQTVALEPASRAAEAYRGIRTRMYFGVSDSQARTLLITSPVQGDGKTTLVSNLAIAMAQAGQRTLVIDADFRKPMQQEVFGVPGTPGLTNVLSGEVSLDEAVQETAIGSLDVLTAGPIPPNPSEMLNSPDFSRMLAELSRRYDRVLLDSPPVLPVTDASILAAICDATVLVLKAGASKRNLAGQARDTLIGVGADILGVVANAVSRDYDHYGYYKCKYNYGRKNSNKDDRDRSGRDGKAAGEQKPGPSGAKQETPTVK